MKTLFLSLIRWYQRKISPHKGSAVCRYYPTCSQYAYEAIEAYGSFWGILLAVGRILRCNPLFKGGCDPVPPSILGGRIKARRN